MTYLVLCDDYYHPGELIEQGLNQLSDADFSYYYQAEPERFTQLTAYQGIILAKLNHYDHTDQSTWLTPAIVSQLITYVKGGGRLFILHAGIVLLNDAPELAELVGCTFAYHPEQSVVTGSASEVSSLGEIASFKAQDEHYFINELPTIGAAFLTTTSADGQQVGGYLKEVEAGKIAVLTPGHTQEMWQQPHFVQVIKQILTYLEATD